MGLWASTAAAMMLLSGTLAGAYDQLDERDPAEPRSVEVLRNHTIVRMKPLRKIRRRGVVMRGARLPILDVLMGEGCGSPWYRVHTDGWICGDHVRPNERDPSGLRYPFVKSGAHTPWPYAFVREPTLEYRLRHGYVEETRDVLKGFGFGVSGVVTIEGRSFLRTAQGNLVPRGSAGISSRVSRFSGTHLTPAEAQLFGWVNGNRTWIYTMPSAKKKFRDQTLARYTWFRILETSGTGRRAFYRIDEGTWLRARDVRVFTPGSVPEGLSPDEKWIDVDIRQQIVTAYRGTVPVFSTLASTGRAGPSRTVKGQYRIWAKVAAIAMDNTDEELEETSLDPESADAGVSDAGPPAERKLYSLHDVPWTQFFFENFAIHGVYWHNRFGNRRSHGCVNLAPRDARWLYDWTHPHLPDGWWAIHSSPADRGTLIRVR